MSALQLLRTLEAHGVEVTVTDTGKLHSSAPPDAITPSHAEAIRRHRDELIALLRLEAAFGPLEDDQDYARRLNPGELGPLDPETMF